jgi:starch synthase (maltosyl-transferring)
MHLTHSPAPGLHRVMFRGDSITFTLSLSEDRPGQAWLRTNLAHGDIIRREIIQAVAKSEPILARDWYDLPMIRVRPGFYQLTLGLSEVGHFEAKCYFLESEQTTPAWPPGDNVCLNVEPAETCCANIIYNAFVRQFGPNKSGAFKAAHDQAEMVKRLDESGYTVIPPSGTFRDLIAHLDFIIGHLGCRILHLLPVNPTPTTYGRMGRFGSPYAALNFTAIDPALAVFDPTATPLEQFIELLDAVHARQAKIIIDIAPNHTGWAAGLHETHPEWLVRDKEGRIEAPGAWGVVWEDLTRLDYGYRELWQYMADVFLTWCRRGVDGFRCDAGYMIPAPAWRYIIASVREAFPDTIFFLEGLGGKISVTRDLLNTAGFNWAYSELFQNYDRPQIAHYLPGALGISEEDGVMIHFAETHDNNRMAAVSPVYAAMRTALCALCSVQGGFGFANGVEWFATEKINVHDASSLNWGAPHNQVDAIRRLNLLLRSHPSFFDQTDIRLIQKGSENTLAVLRHHRPCNKRLIIAVNLDCEHPAVVSWDADEAGIQDVSYHDLLNDQAVGADAVGSIRRINLNPGQVRCLTADPNDRGLLAADPSAVFSIPDRTRRQCLRAMVLDIHRFHHGMSDLSEFDPDTAAAALAADPMEFCRDMNPHSAESRVTSWQWPEDSRRQVMIPPDHFLMLKAPGPFRAALMETKNAQQATVAVANSVQADDGSHFTLFQPRPARQRHIRAMLKFSLFGRDRHTHVDAHLLFLTHAENIRVHRRFDRGRLLASPLCFTDTNGRGGMMRAHAAWGVLQSKYDALLGANPHPHFPVDRRMMLIRCRAWLVFQGYSQEISIDALSRFTGDYGDGCRWDFCMPSGQGQHVMLNVLAKMVPDRNQVNLFFSRRIAGDGNDQLPADKPVTIIIRPDIDDRSFHEITKAYLGAEHVWPSKCRHRSNGFLFQPAPDRKLDMKASSGTFVWEPEWHYMVHLPMEAERGMDAHTDLFSPGYFKLILKGDETVLVTASADIDNPEAGEIIDQAPPASSFMALSAMKPGEAMTAALKHYVVRRENLKTVIAGYPWFLDWGRDTLIAVRGLIAAEMFSETGPILKQFARFEKNGTLPNMIRGDNADNRDTSDAPLWFFVACDEFIAASGDFGFPDAPCGSRTIREVLISIAESYMAGTPNGIRMDPDSGLIFSPSHFTWMDTNFPAATPRMGYPVEIQALWHYALRFLSRIDIHKKNAHWTELAGRVEKSIRDLFYRRKEGYLSDCLHADPGVCAAAAVQDDALRPNQLYAVTLGAVVDIDTIRRIVHNCETLIVPGAIRSLADRPVTHPLPVVYNGRPCNDPNRPYQGVYTGNEDTRRKPAYHNGTAWTWVFPAFCEAWHMAYGAAGKKTALALLGSSSQLINSGSAGQIPEIVDGNYPHTQRGCDAQAWGVSEWLRVWNILHGK